MTKREIENAGIAGTRLDLDDVATVSRNSRSITLRHVWKDDDDGCVLAAIGQAYMRGARELAKRTGKSIEVYSKEGFMLEAVGDDD